MTIFSKVAMETKRKHFIDGLLAEGITQDKDGKSIYDMANNELKFELAMALILKTDIESPENKWF